MGATLTTFDSVLKNDYLPPLRDSLNNATVLLARVQRNEKDVFGKKIVIPIRYQRSAGVGARGEGGTLPTAGSQGYVETNPPMRYNYGRVSVTGIVMKAARSDRGSFIRAIDSEIRGMELDLKRDINRQLFRAGTGQRAICGTTSTSLTVVLAAGQDTRWLQVGQVVDILTISSGVAVTNGSARTIQSINRTASPPTLVIDTAGSTVSTDGTVGVYNTSGYNKEMMGLDGIINSVDPDGLDIGTGSSNGKSYLQGLAVATYDFWVSTVTSNSGTAGTNAPLSLVKMQQTYDDIEIASGKSPTLLIGHHRVRAQYLNLLVADRRFVKDLALDGGFSAVAYTSAGQETPFVVDRDCYPGNTLYFVHEPDLTIYRQADFDWMDEDGSILFRISGQDAYEATLFTYMEMGTPQRNSHGRLNDISIEAVNTSSK